MGRGILIRNGIRRTRAQTFLQVLPLQKAKKERTEKRLEPQKKVSEKPPNPLDHPG